MPVEAHRGRVVLQLAATGADRTLDEVLHRLAWMLAAARLEDGADVDALFVSKATVDKGPNKFNRRWRPRAMGRATRITKGISHIVIELDERK